MDTLYAVCGLRGHADVCAVAAADIAQAGRDGILSLRLPPDRAMTDTWKFILHRCGRGTWMRSQKHAQSSSPTATRSCNGAGADRAVAHALLVSALPWSPPSACWPFHVSAPDALQVTVNLREQGSLERERDRLEGLCGTAPPSELATFPCQVRGRTERVIWP